MVVHVGPITNEEDVCALDCLVDDLDEVSAGRNAVDVDEDVLLVEVFDEEVVEAARVGPAIGAPIVDEDVELSRSRVSLGHGAPAPS
jgi:hypothetical protein